MMRDRRYGEESRHRSPTPPPRRLSPPPGRFRDRVEYRGYSSPRRRYNMDLEEERRGGGLSRRDYDRYHEKHYDRGGGKEYERNFSRGEKLNDRDYDRNFSRGDRDSDRGFSRGGGGGGRGRGRGRGTRVVSYNGDYKDDGRSFGRGGEGMRLPNYNGDDRDGDRSFTRGGGGTRIPNYNGGDRDRDRGYGDRERDRDGGRTRSVYQSSGDGEYSRNVYGSSTGTQSKFQAGTQSKFQWDHLLDETRKSDGFKSSIDRGVGGSGVRSDLEYDYQETKFFDKGRDGLVLDSKPMLIETERGRDYSSSSYPANVSFSTNSSSHVNVIGSGISMSSRYTTSGLHKDEDFHFQDKIHSEKLVADGPVMRDSLTRESYKDKLLQYSSLDTDYMASSSRLKAFDPVPLGSFKEDIPSSFRDDLRLPSDGVRASIGMATNSIGYNRSGEKSRTRSPMDHEGRFGEFKSYSQSYLSTAEEKHRDYAYPVVGSGERGGTLPRFSDLYGKAPSVGEDYRRQDISRLGILDSIGDRGDESSHHGYLRGSRLLGHHSTSLGQSTSDYYNANDSFLARRKDVEGQGYGSPQHKYERESYRGLRSSRLGEHNDDHEVAGGSRFHHRLSDVLPSREYDLQLGDIDGRSQEKLTLGNVSFSKPFKNRLKRKHAEKQFSGHSNPSYDLEDEGEPWRDNVDSNILSKRLEVSKSKYGKSRRALNMTARHQSPPGTVSFFPSSHYRRSNISGTRDIKKRLGPIAPKVHVSQRLVKKYKPSLKKRLGPGPQKNHVTLPWLKNLNAPNLPRIQDGSGGSDRVQAEDHHEDNVAHAKPEPPENSEDFKHLVKIAFFKFVKQLNDTPAKRRKYKELGIAGSLKCIVCRSQEEFIGTESLATHAFTCQKVGLRSGHLGFHKALCAFMGWKYAEKPNNTWLPEIMSDVENLALKEDLILWPPVVIVHNSTIGNKNSDQRVIVSIEELEAKLQDMGFGETKVYRGKPANQSVMVVEFAGRLSGLQEAERLHKVYADNNHGRAEFLQVESCSIGSHGGVTESAPVNKVENILYGYLGIAEDLDKLDFDAKKRRLVKSRKEIKDVAEASIKTK